MARPFRRLFFLGQSLVVMPLLRAGLRLKVRGPRLREYDGGVILAPNHQSWIDPGLVQYAVFPQQITFLMTELYYDLPVANLYFRAAGARPVREDGPSVSGMRAAYDALRNREIVCLFPEGQITTTGDMSPGQAGVARLARRTGVPVVPVGIRGAIHVLSKLQKWPRLHPVEVHLGRPMRFRDDDGRDAEAPFTDHLMREIRRLAYGESTSRACIARSRRKRHAT